MTIEELKWDSEFFGIRIGRITNSNLKNFDAKLFNEQVQDERFDLVYVINFGEMLPWKSVSQANLDLVEIMVTMTKKFDKPQYQNRNYKFRMELSDQELDGCYKIAEATSVVSRFGKEPWIGPEKTKLLYRKWIDNTLNGSFADGLFLYKEAKEIAGLHIIRTDEKNKIGYTSIIAVDPDLKGRGIGKKLWHQAFNYWVNEKEIEYCKVPFSFRNIESFNFHLKMGFNIIEETKYIYHFRKEN
jgi:dTDP-4-amino-4,6-dideoxy-D-galactose acyltransferase